tara:strand:+ start:254 stop:655 length:402 start_codon:yes stop_codon:yes gene_type:complete
MADRLDGLIISEILADNAGGAAIDTDGDGNTNKSDEFIEIQNTTGSPLSLDGYEIWSEKQGELYRFGPSDTIASGGTATVVGNYDGTTRIGAGEQIDSNAPNGTAFARNADGDFEETSPDPGNPGMPCFAQVR